MTLDLGFYAVVANAAVGAAVTLVITAASCGARPIRRRVPSGRCGGAAPRGAADRAALAVSEIFFRLDTLLVSAFRSYDEVGPVLARVPNRRADRHPARHRDDLGVSLLSSYLRDDAARAARTIDAAGDLFVAVGVPIAAAG